jgi:hypothetical protein
MPRSGFTEHEAAHMELIMIRVLEKYGPQITEHHQHGCGAYKCWRNMKGVLAGAIIFAIITGASGLDTLKTFMSVL